MSEEFDVELPHENREVDKWWYLIDIRDLGEKPMAVEEGQIINVLMKATKDDETRQSAYGHGGYRDTYSNIEDQEYDFDTDYSSFNGNSTDPDWGQFPFLLYTSWQVWIKYIYLKILALPILDNKNSKI